MKTVSNLPRILVTGCDRASDKKFSRFRVKSLRGDPSNQDRVRVSSFEGRKIGILRDVSSVYMKKKGVFENSKSRSGLILEIISGKLRRPATTMRFFVPRKDFGNSARTDERSNEREGGRERESNEKIADNVMSPEANAFTSETYSLYSNTRSRWSSLRIKGFASAKNRTQKECSGSEPDVLPKPGPRAIYETSCPRRINQRDLYFHAAANPNTPIASRARSRIAGKCFIKCGCLKSPEKLLACAAAPDNDFGNTRREPRAFTITERTFAIFS